MTGDRWIQRLTASVVMAVAAFAAIVSYSHIYDLARGHGQAGIDARLLPLSVDGLIASASLVLLYEARQKRSAPGLARWMLALGVAATVAANIAYGLPFGPLGSIVSAWPAVAFIGSVEMATAMVRRCRLSGQVSGQRPARDPAAGQASGQKAGQEARGNPRRIRSRGRTDADLEAAALAALAGQPDMSGADLGRAIGVSERTGQRVRARLAAPDSTP